MLGSIKALIVVLAIGATIFRLAQPIALKFIAEEDFSRRRNLWFLLTAVSFVSPNLWLYALVAVPLLLRAGRKDSNPTALYLMMLHVIPPVAVTIPILGNNGLFSLDNYRLLAMCVLVPAIIRYRKHPEAYPRNAFGGMDVLLLVFGVLQVALYTPPDLPHHFVIPDSLSNALRRGVLFLLDVYILYFAVSRTCVSRRRIEDAAASFCVACAVIAAIAIFERTKGWLLYVDIASRWGTDPNAAFYLARGGAVRAQVSAGHSIALGYLLAVAFGLWLYLMSRIQSGLRRIAVVFLLWGGLFASFSRGSWLGGVATYCTFLAVGPRAVSRLVKGLTLALVAAVLVAMSPIGDRIIAVLPVMGGTTDASADSSIVYRQRLAERGWELVLAHPFFGDQFPWPEMEDLRQGEGIIDLVNTYLGTALSYGLIGLFCFVSFMVLAIRRVYAHLRKVAYSDPEATLLGASLIACIVGILIMIQSVGFGLGVQRVFYVLAGLASAYSGPNKVPQGRPEAPSARIAQG
jgi:O-antigen ligase